MAQREHAVVIGGSMAGLLAARVLSDHFQRVTLIERDKLPDGKEHRGGVPQARHIHGLLARGLSILETLFPGFEADLAAAGAPRIEWMVDTIQLIPTGWTPRFHSGIFTYACSRPLVESLVRARVQAIRNIDIMDGWIVTGLTAEGDRVTGVSLEPRPRGEGRTLSADLVIDAGGRGSRTPEWLLALGYNAPEETLIDPHLGYSSRLYRMPQHPGWRTLMMMTTPALPRGGVFTEIENGLWMMTLAGTAGDLPPTDEEGLKAFARSIPASPLHEALEIAEPLSPIYGYHRTSNRLRHYEKLSRFPEGLLVTGDAVCAFNPIYGQGMTAAALDAQVLDGWLRKGGSGLDFQKRLARSNQAPWGMATNEDYRYPTTEGAPPPAIVARLNRYVDWLFDAAPEVPEVTQAFLRVMHLVAPPTVLFSPSLILKRLRWHKRGDRAHFPMPRQELS